MISATIFSLGSINVNRSNREIGEELSKVLVTKYPEKYWAGRSLSKLVILYPTRLDYPRDPSIRRFRSISCNVLRLSDKVLLEACVSNYFDFPNEGIKNKTQLNEWKKRASNITWSEHISLISEFILDLKHVGITLPLEPPSSYYESRGVMYKNSEGIYKFKQGVNHQLMKYPLQKCHGIKLVVIDSQGITNKQTESAIKAAVTEIFIGTAIGANSIRTTREFILDDGYIGLIVLPMDWTPSKQDPIYQGLVKLEMSGSKFKVCKLNSIYNKYALSNIVYNMFAMAGGVFWTTETHRERKVIALDAGHDAITKKSRWCAAYQNTGQSMPAIDYIDGPLRENLTKDILNRLLSSSIDKGEEIWRDGKWHKSDCDWLSFHAKGVHAYEIVKNPKAVLFWGSLDDKPSPPKVGDSACFGMEHWLVQTMGIIERNDCSQPLCVRGPVDEQWLDDFIALSKRPDLSMFHQSRLPKPLFWADRASKLSISGWLRITGQGWRLAGPL